MVSAENLKYNNTYVAEYYMTIKIENPTWNLSQDMSLKNWISDIVIIVHGIRESCDLIFVKVS